MMLTNGRVGSWRHCGAVAERTGANRLCAADDDDADAGANCR